MEKGSSVAVRRQLGGSKAAVSCLSAFVIFTFFTPMVCIISNQLMTNQLLVRRLI